MVMKVGMIGYSDGNGHPFSFAAIINGYDEAAFKETGWEVILNYLKKQPRSAFGFEDVQVTHAWTQDIGITHRLCRACYIPNALSSLEEMHQAVDAVIIARDDYDSHLALARPFLESGKKVFIDKPLTLDPDELNYFLPYLEKGQLMSTSGLRYATEVDALREPVGLQKVLGKLVLISGVILYNLEKYGIHLLEAIYGLGIGKPVKVTRTAVRQESFSIELDSHVIFNLICLGPVAKVLHLCFYGTENHVEYQLLDNFTAFRRTLDQFFKMVKVQQPPIDPRETLQIMNLIAKAQYLKLGETLCVEG